MSVLNKSVILKIDLITVEICMGIKSSWRRDPNDSRAIIKDSNE